MKAMIAIVFAMGGFIFITANQIQTLAILKLHQNHELTTQIVNDISYKVKLTSISFAITALIFYKLYNNTGAHKLKIINKLALIVSILTLIFCFLPVYKLFI